MLYEDGGSLNLAADEDDAPSFDSSVFDDVADLIYQAGGFDINQIKDPKARKLILETVAAINRGVDAHLPTDVPDTLRYALEENSFIFSGFKTFHAMREIGLSLVTDKGEIKPYAQFQADVLKINQRYNTAYLYAEYKHAVGTCQMAAKWAAMERDGDRYLLQYRTAEDDRVRDDHAAMNGITLPPSDPFWDKYYPPNGWGCRCTAVQVRRGKYAESDPARAMLLGDNSTEAAKQQMFRFNAGKQMRLFPPKHPYFKAPAEAKKVITETVKEETQEQRKKRYSEELPSYLTDTEKEAIVKNMLEIEDKANITKGTAMSVDDADKQSANPHHGEAYGYSVNCQTCAPAYVLRLRGFNFTAKAKTSGSLSEYLARQRSFEAWLNPDGTPCQGVLTADWMAGKGYKRMNAKRYKEYFEETCKAEGVYILTIGWKGGGGHATILQRFADGTLSYIEPQVYDEKTGSRRPIDELCNGGGAVPYHKRGILRVDNKIFNLKFLSIFDK